MHDIVATGALSAEEAAAAVRIQAAFHIDDQVENGNQPQAGETALWVADALQANLIEGLGISDRLVTWPPCPDHRNHPLWLRSPNETVARRGEAFCDDPVWTCPTTGKPIAELGKLQVPT